MKTLYDRLKPKHKEKLNQSGYENLKEEAKEGLSNNFVYEMTYLQITCLQDCIGEFDFNNIYSLFDEL